MGGKGEVTDVPQNHFGPLWLRGACLVLAGNSYAVQDSRDIEVSLQNLLADAALWSRLPFSIM